MLAGISEGGAKSLVRVAGYHDRAGIQQSLDTGADGESTLVRVGRIELPPPLSGTLDAWWLRQYGGGLFLPVRIAQVAPTSLADVQRQLGVYVGRILKGEKPADLPVQQITKIELAVNLTTAKIMGIEVPPSILIRADEIIE